MQREKFTRQSGCPTYNFAVVVIKHPTEDLFVAVKEKKNRGWYLPAGFVEAGDDFVKTAHKETLEEAGVRIRLKGVLRVEHGINSYFARMRVVFFAEPDPEAERHPPKLEGEFMEKFAPSGQSAEDAIHNRLKKHLRWELKKVKDPESEGAQWVTINELAEMDRKGLARDSCLLHWANYILHNGNVHPLDILATEGKLVPQATAQRMEQFIRMDDLDGVKQLIINENVDIDYRINGSKRWTPLLYAAAHSKEQICRWLLENGADVQSTTHKGRNALFISMQRSVSVTKLLLEHGCLLHPMDKKMFESIVQTEPELRKLLSDNCGKRAKYG